ncbi:MAG: response regulator, partial [Gammaproteobacteria bacterium]|nr:response regulator [Gammaproteobacteria bacterium]
MLQAVSDPNALSIKGARIMIVEDNDYNRDILRRRLDREGYDVIECVNGREAVNTLKTEKVDMILLDIMMPEMNGYEVLEIIKKDEGLKNIPVVVISALSEIDNAVKCIELGAEDHLPKPFSPTLLRARINAGLQKKLFYDREVQYKHLIEDQNRNLEARVSDQVKQISETQMAAIFAMSKLAESRDPETGEHLERMREYCKILAYQMSKTVKHKDLIDDEFIANIYAASPLHDIGKVGIPDSVLIKPGKLTEDEWVIMRSHPVIGADTLRAVDKQHPGNQFIKVGIAIAEYHHERWDGTGYPHGLKGDSIPLEARILALGDVYDALTSQRCYKKAFSREKTNEIIEE